MIAERLTSDLLTAAGLQHGFFTRKGGVSPPPWAALNVGGGSGDDPSRVEENLERAAAALGVERGRLFVLDQVHGTACVVVGAETPGHAAARQGDVALSASPGAAACVRTADCVPVLVADRSTGAVCAIHSGWRGTAQNVARAGIDALRGLVGGPGALVAAIGPHIEACCFEVSDDVARELAAASSLGVRAVIETPGRPRIDLRRIVRAQLEAAGLSPRDVDDVRGCTVCDEDRFFSHRRDRSPSGRLLSGIVARAPGAAR